MVTGGQVEEMTTAVAKERRSSDPSPKPTVPLPDRFGIYIECGDEEEQLRLLRELTMTGHRCRAVLA